MSETDVLRDVVEELKSLKEMVAKLASRPEQPRNYKHSAAARLLGVSPKTVSRMVAAGELMPIQIRGKSLIPIAEIDRVSRPPRMESSGATENQLRYDGAAALKKLKELRKDKKR